MSDSRSWGLVLCALLGGACTEMPGEVVGTYRVTMTLEKNTCGASAVHSLDKHRYRVELRADDQHGYWHVPGQTPIQGDFDAPEFRFEYAGLVASSRPDAGPNGCRLVQSDVVSGSVEANKTHHKDAGADESSEADAAADAEVDPDDESASDDEEISDTTEADAGAPVQGTHEMTISAASGTDCREALPPEGAFEKLPCMVRYRLDGTPTKAF